MHLLPEWIENERLYFKLPGTNYKSDLSEHTRGNGLNVNDVQQNRLLALLPILTIKLTFSCVPAAERDQSDDADEQDTASADRSADNYQHGQRFCNRKQHRVS